MLLPKMDKNIIEDDQERPEVSQVAERNKAREIFFQVSNKKSKEEQELKGGG